jgi:prepilin-type N-terminal cleavage/methylation domain-containing protein
MVRRHVRPNAGFTLVEIMVVLAVILVLMGIGFLAYNKFIGQSKESKMYADMKQLGTAILAMYQDTGALAGMDQTNVPFPDSLFNVNSIKKDTVKTKWRGPYVKNPPVCPFDDCRYETDYKAGQANNVGETYLYFITASNVPLENALALARNVDGDERITKGECLASKIKDTVSGNEKPCEVYLENNTGGAGTKIKVYYVFMTGRY